MHSFFASAFFLLLVVAVSGASNHTYTVSVLSSPDVPVLSWIDGSSAFAQIFNAAWVESSSRRGLLARAQNCTQATPGGNCVHCSGADGAASVLVFAELRGSDGADVALPTFLSVGAADVIFGPGEGLLDRYGTEDPRVVYDPHTQLHYLFYTCYGPSSVLLCLATTTNPTAANGWTRHGPVFPSIQDSKSAVLVPPARAGEEYVLIWGAGKVRVARSKNPLKWPENGGSEMLIEPRPNGPGWDSKGVESGPAPPAKLSTGDLFFVYNAWDLAGEVYRPGWVILDGKDPGKVLQRADTPFLAPTRPWEKGSAPYTCNVGNVVFVEAMHAIDSNPDVFRIYFGGADAVLGTAVIKVATL